MKNLHDILLIIRTEGVLKNLLLRRPNTCFRYGRNLLDQSNMPRITERQLNTVIGKRRILIYGLPKSGNVWLTSMLYSLFDLQENQVSFTHNYPTSRAEKLVMLYRSEIIRSVLLIRDPRDILYSLYKMSFTQNWRDERTRGIFNTIDKFFFDYYLPVYIKSRNPFEMWDFVARYVPVIRYEHLRSNCHDELGHLAYFKTYFQVNSMGISDFLNRIVGPGGSIKKVRSYYREGLWDPLMQKTYNGCVVEIKVGYIYNGVRVSEVYGCNVSNRGTEMTYVNLCKRIR